MRIFFTLLRLIFFFFLTCFFFAENFFTLICVERQLEVIIQVPEPVFVCFMQQLQPLNACLNEIGAHITPGLQMYLLFSFK